MLSTKTKITLASAVQKPLVTLRRIAGMSQKARVARRGLQWQLDLNEGIDFAIWLLGSFELRTIQAYSQIVQPGHVVFDIGANVGAHTLPLARRVGEHGRVHAFEPVRWAIDKLADNLGLNPDLSPRVSVHQLMLTDQPDAEIPPSIHASWPLGSGHDVHPTLRARQMPTAGASATTLDAFVRENRIDRLDFIKLDVDGHEYKVLHGGQDTLRRFRPPIVIELSPHSADESGATFDALIALLADLGYDFRELDSDRPLPADASALRRLIPARGGINAVLIHSGNQADRSGPAAAAALQD